MSKFRKWLIKKLGGFTKEDLPIKPIEIRQQNVQLVPIKVVYQIDPYSLIFFNEKDARKVVERNVTFMIAEKIKPEFVYEESSMSKSIMAKILIPSNYVKENK